MTEPKRPAHVPEGVRWGYVTLGTGEQVEAWYDGHRSCFRVHDPTDVDAPWTLDAIGRPLWEPIDPVLKGTWDQCSRLYEAEGTGYIELSEPENSDRTHPDSGVTIIDWEARRWEAMMRALTRRMPYERGDERPEHIAQWAAEVANAALAVYREDEK